MALSLAPVTVTHLPGSAAPLPQGANGNRIHKGFLARRESRLPSAIVAGHRDTVKLQAG